MVAAPPPTDLGPAEVASWASGGPGVLEWCCGNVRLGFIGGFIGLHGDSRLLSSEESWVSFRECKAGAGGHEYGLSCWFQ